MHLYPKYKLEEGAMFHPDQYPELIDDLAEINLSFVNIRCTVIGDMLISFTRDHSLKTGLVAGNPEVADKLLFGGLPLNNMECLFVAIKGNSIFQQQFESFLKSKLNWPQV